MKTIGIKLADGSFFPIMEDNHPAQKALELTTAHNNQTKVMVDLYRSKSCSMDDAEYVDSLQIDNLVSHPNGEPSIAFSVSLDENSQLSANIKDPETGYESETAIPLVTRSEEELLVPDEYDISNIDDTDKAEPVKKGGLLSAADKIMENKKKTDLDEPIFGDDALPDFSDDTGIADISHNDMFSTDAFLKSDDEKVPETENTEKIEDNFFDDTEIPDFTSDVEQPEEAAIFDDQALADFSDISEEPTETVPDFSFESEEPIVEQEETFEEPIETEASAEEENPIESESFDEPAESEPLEETEDFDVTAESEPLATETPVEEESPIEIETPPESEDFDIPVESEPLAETEDFDLPAESEPLEETENFDEPVESEPLEETENFDEPVESEPLEETENFDLPAESEPETNILPDFDQSSETDSLEDFPDFDKEPEEVSSNDELEQSLAESKALNDIFSKDENEDSLPDFDNLDTDTSELTDDNFFDLDNTDITPESDNNLNFDNEAEETFGLPDDFDNFDDSDSDSDNESYISDINKYPMASSPIDDFSIPDFPEDNSSSDLPDNFFDDFDDSPSSSAGPLSFTGLYDKETEMGMSGMQSDEITKKTKGPVIICIICALICIIATAFILLVKPKTDASNKINITKENQENIILDNQSGTQEDVQIKVVEDSKPLPPPVPEAKEDEIVIIEQAEKVIPKQPEVIKENLNNISYQVIWGDTLWDIANTYYKNPWKYTDIAKYNSIKNPDHIISGTTLVIPAE